MKKKGFGLWILFVVFGTALICVFFSPVHGYDQILAKPNRKLLENFVDDNGYGNIDPNDYLPTDPVPSSKAASLRPGPIEHGTPLMPYIPKPSPPGPNDPNYGGLP